MKPHPYTISELVPLAMPMILLEEVVDYNEMSFHAALTVRETSLFIEEQGIPGHIALEYMAQTCGAFAGVSALSANQIIDVGFLLGTRNFHTYRDWYRLGERIEVWVKLIFGDVEMSAFDCKVKCDDILTAQARLNLFKPKSAAQFLQTVT